jgi:hypothetical protein
VETISLLDYIRTAFSAATLIGVIIAFYAWRSKQNLDRRNLAIGYSLTKNKQYFDARSEIANRFKIKIARNEKLTEEDVANLKANSDRIVPEIKFVLSHWEIMAISIFDNIIDEKTCFEMVGSTLVNTVRLLENYIVDARCDPQNIRRYDYLMVLYEEWKARIELAEKNGPISRYQQYLEDGKDRANLESRLEDDRQNWRAESHSRIKSQILKMR